MQISSVPTLHFFKELDFDKMLTISPPNFLNWFTQAKKGVNHRKQSTSESLITVGGSRQATITSLSNKDRIFEETLDLTEVYENLLMCNVYV